MFNLNNLEKVKKGWKGFFFVLILFILWLNLCQQLTSTQNINKENPRIILLNGKSFFAEIVSSFSAASFLRQIKTKVLLISLPHFCCIYSIKCETYNNNSNNNSHTLFYLFYYLYIVMKCEKDI